MYKQTEERIVNAHPQKVQINVMKSTEVFGPKMMKVIHVLPQKSPR